MCLVNFIFSGGGSHPGQAHFWGVRWGFFSLHLLGVCGSCLCLWFGGWGMCALFDYVALLVALKTPSFLHVLFVFFIRKLLEREGSGGINIHGIGVLCFGVIVSRVLGGPRVSGPWSNSDELEVLGFCSGCLLPLHHVLGNCLPH